MSHFKGEITFRCSETQYYQGFLTDFLPNLTNTCKYVIIYIEVENKTRIL